jgi:hypothetical protein
MADRNLSLAEQRSAGIAFCVENLVVLCAEMIEWQQTGLLPTGKLRELAGLFSFSGSSAMEMAKTCVNQTAIRKIVSESLAVAAVSSVAEKDFSLIP